ncbi:MAG: T9SS type A sorting domain-containing protein [candidate division Zixibacteria bacterium]|nr:T9SS type A sorting domain-containing protein [candidate division Zixibacteria bacterium]MDH3937676.1 T9SS type A sorting domain-containing protein [candidate division Zixibacteria bacterium]MDH4032331.1 T9SS type A sorting domain-containing protein [candidate division Zixibacteria bacterium]
MNPKSIALFTSLILTLMLSTSPGTGVAAIVADHTVIPEFESIPASVIQQVKSDFRLFYGHTSHGNQIIAGMNVLRGEDPLYAFTRGPVAADSLSIEENDQNDLCGVYDFPWMNQTRTALDQEGCDRNVVMWSWCSGMTWQTEQGINMFCDSMSQLEAEYPDITFIYMTGHLDNSNGDNLLLRNQQLRDFCVANNKVLFDFADIDSYDPDGVYHADPSEWCDWCDVWCASHDCPSCYDIGCSHSHDFSCYRKGKAFWWMMATMAGWSLALDVEDYRSGTLPDRFLLMQNYPNPFNPQTSIRFELAGAGYTSLELYNVAGQKVATLVDEHLSAGEYVTSWNGHDSNGNQAASGVYFYRLESGELRSTRKMVLLR